MVRACRVLASATCCLLTATACPLLAEPATERYAASQLRVAEEGLEDAMAAKARGQVDAAAAFAAQASLDARLAWSMSESPAIKREAAKIHRGAVGVGLPTRPGL